MAQWILHIVGETLDDDLAEPISKFVQEIEKLSHKVGQIRLTTDQGEKILDVTHAVGEAVDDVDPAAAPDVAAVETEETKVVDSVEAPPVETTTPVADPPPAVPVVEAPVDVIPPVEPAPVDPPVAGASSTDSSPTSTTIPPAPIPAS